MKRHVLAVIVLFALSMPAAAHHTKEHMLQPPVAIATAPAPEETGMQLWYALGPFFLLVAVGLARWGLKHRATRRSRKD